MEIDSLRSAKGEIDLENIKKVIPYEDPFLFLDKVLLLEKKRIIAERTVHPNEPHLKGHFRDFPIMPGALIVEGVGQAATLLVRYNLKNHEKYDVLAYRITGAKFFRPTFPGHTIRYEAKLFFKFRSAWFVRGIVSRNEKIVAKVNMVLAVVDKDKFRNRK